jgi:hypothetical protein
MATIETNIKKSFMNVKKDIDQLRNQIEEIRTKQGELEDLVQKLKSRR